MELFYMITFFIFGTVFGSFFNVVGLRVPKKESFHRSRSYCPSCKKTLQFYELIPIISYVLQRGKCRNCQQSISPIYPVIELATGILFVLAYVQLGFTWELITALLLTSLLMIIFVSDIKYMLIPNKVLLFFLPFLIVMRIVVPLNPWYDAIVGAVIAFVLLAIIIIVSKGGMGAGDMKLFGILGIVLGLWKVLLTFFLAALFGAVIGGAFMLFNKVKRKQPIPFGPFIVLATFITYYWGDNIIDWYLKLL